MANTNIIAPSKLDRSNLCPLKFRKDEYESHDEASVAQQMGIDKHALMEKVFTKPEQLHDNEVEQANQILGSVINDLGLFTGDTVQTVAEEKFMIPFEHAALHGIKDLVQRIEDRVLIIDWKTGKKFYRKEEVEASLQGKIYALHEFTKSENTEIVFFRIAMTEYGKVVGTEYWRDNIQELHTEVKLAVEYFRSCYELKKFPAKPGSHCGYCKHISTCPHNIMTNGKEHLTGIDTDTLFIQSVKDIMVTEKYMTMLKDMSDSYAKNKIGSENYIGVGDVHIFRKERVTERVSTSKKAKEILEKYADKLGLKMDTSIKKIRELGEDEINKLKELGVISQTVSETIDYKIGGMVDDNSDKTG